MVCLAVNLIHVLFQPCYNCNTFLSYRVLRLIRHVSKTVSTDSTNLSGNSVQSEDEWLRTIKEMHKVELFETRSKGSERRESEMILVITDATGIIAKSIK